MITQYRSIENILKNIDSSKYPSPEDWNYEKARKLFLEPEVSNSDSIDVSRNLLEWLFCFLNFLNFHYDFIVEVV